MSTKTVVKNDAPTIVRDDRTDNLLIGLILIQSEQNGKMNLLESAGLETDKFRFDIHREIQEFLGIPENEDWFYLRYEETRIDTKEDARNFLNSVYETLSE